MPRCLVELPNAGACPPSCCQQCGCGQALGDTVFAAPSAMGQLGWGGPSCASVSLMSSRVGEPSWPLKQYRVCRLKLSCLVQHSRCQGCCVSWGGAGGAPAGAEWAQPGLAGCF